MPQVPYNPVPQERPSEAGTPSVRVNTPVEAFGGAVGHALEGFGSQLEHVGNELFTRAIALQQLRNETEAKEADAKYMMDVGEMHANYSALQGKDAVDAYPKYIQGIQERRQQLRQDLSNDMARRMYDSSSLSTMGRTIFNGAGHAATQNKQYAIGAATSQMDLDAKAVADDPNNERTFQEKLAKTRANATNVAAMHGLPEGSPQEKEIVQKASSKLWLQRITGQARVAPFEAAQVLDKNKKQLTEDDYLRADNIVRGQGRAVGAAGIAEDVYNNGVETPTKPGKPLKEMEDEARAKAKKLSPDDPVLEDHAVKAVQGKWNQSKYAQRQEQLENEQTVAGAIQQGVKNEQELRANPKIAAAIDALPKDKQLAIPSRINNYNAARDRVTKEDEERRLRGLSSNDVEAFLNEDVLGNKSLNKGDADRLFTLQQRIKTNQNADPRVGKALSWMRGAVGAQLEALGIYSRTQQNKDDYDKFTGALQSALDVYQETHKKPADYKAVIEEIAPRVIQQRDEPGRFWGTNKKPFYEQEVPENFSAGYRGQVKANATDEEIYKAYTRMQYMKLYQKKESKSE